MNEKEIKIKEEWIDMMVKELSTEEKLRADLSDYYDLIQINSEVIFLLSGGLLSKPNYNIEVYEKFLEEYCVAQKKDEEEDNENDYEKTKKEK